MGLALMLPQQQLRQLRLRLVRGGLREIGGWLVAEELAPGHFELVGMTVDYSSGDRSRFVNRPAAHDAKFEELRNHFKGRTGRVDYLGEWHSHPMHSVSPSEIDVGSMTDMVERSGPSFAVLLIARLRGWLSVEASLTLFQRGEPPVAAELIVGAREQAHA